MKKTRNILEGSIGEAPSPEDVKADRSERAQQEAEEAFDRSAGYVFGGEALKAFSLERQAAAQRLGLKYGKLKPGEVERIPIVIPAPETPVDGKGRAKGKPKKEDKLTTYYINYPGMLDDCVLVLFLCTLEPEEIVMIRGAEKESAFWVEAYKWAEEKGVGYLNSGHGNAYVLFRTIVGDIGKTAVTVDRSQKNPGATDGGDTGN